MSKYMKKDLSREVELVKYAFRYYFSKNIKKHKAKQAILNAIKTYFRENMEK